MMSGTAQGSTRLGQSPHTSSQVQSGVQRLNEGLVAVFDRLSSCTLRINTLADQFGAPETPANPVPPEGPIINTDQHMGNLHRALLRLEQSITRIDNQ